MFTCFNLCGFGNHLKQIRKSFGYTQEDVRRLSGINPDTLRNIENGKVIPRFDTLEYLSLIYKKDLLNDLRHYRNSNTYLQYYSRLSNLILNYNLDTLRNLKNDWDEFVESQKTEDTLLNASMKEQFALVLEGITLYNSEKSKASLRCFVDAVKMTNSFFDLDKFTSLKYSYFELRILLLISLSLAKKNNFQKSNNILSECLNQSNFDFEATFNEKLLITLIYFNLSYNSHKLNFYDKSLSYAKLGIEHSNKNHISYSLAPLLYRKGIAEYLLCLDNYKDTLNFSISLLLITDRKKLAALYAKKALDVYGIVLT
ncbi:MAG: hypothetical protein COA82_05700 [Alkaliphilus sp.]|nr:MAG: hypothetical protein COA82_05700 [Alkaliphilus sp.]